jgi:hypothetical protein
MPFNQEAFESALRMLMKMVINAQKQAAIAQTLACLAAPEVPEETRQRVLHPIAEAYDALLRSIDQAPVDDALALLRAFEGTVQ